MLREATFPYPVNTYLRVLASFTAAVHIAAGMRSPWRRPRRYLMQAHGLDEDEAVSLTSVAVDFGVTQVVDGNWGVHAVIPKRALGAA